MINRKYCFHILEYYTEIISCKRKLISIKIFTFSIYNAYQISYLINILDILEKIINNLNFFTIVTLKEPYLTIVLLIMTKKCLTNSFYFFFNLTFICYYMPFSKIYKRSFCKYCSFR